MWLARDLVSEAIEVSLERRSPFLKALVVQERGEPQVQLPRAAFGASRLGDDGASHDLKSETHA